MVKKGIAALLIASMVVTGMNVFPGTVQKTEGAESEYTTVEVNRDATYASNGGVFEGWGTSLCWFGNRIGGSEQTSNEAAKLLCNEEEGLGLDIIRFNIGGGDDPTHNHITRTDSKMPGYWGEYDEETDTFTYDFSKDANQRNVLKKMQAENEDLTVEAFSNSAPYFMTVSGCTSGSEDGGDNLKEDKYDDFAEYLAQVIKYYKENYDVNFTSVEAMNENGWSIERNGAKQEGCSFARGESQSKMLVEMDKALKNNGLEDVILAGCDESCPSETVTAIELLSEEAKAALERIDTHTYATGREGILKELATEMNKSLWMSETDGGDATSKGGEMAAALMLARRISRDMNQLNPSAWILWQAIGSYCGSEPYEGNNDPVSLDQVQMDTNGFWGVTYVDMDQEKVVLTKKYYGFGQYSRYIKKDDIMLTSTEGNVVSYDPLNNEVKIVISNLTTTDKKFQYNLSGFEFENPTVEVVRTSGDLATGENWAKVENLTLTDSSFKADVKPHSITTYIVKEYTEPEATATVQPTQNPQQPAQTVAPAETTKTPDVVEVKKVSGVKVSKVKKNTAVVSWKKVDGAKYKVAYATSKKKLAKIKNGSVKAAGTTVKNAAKNKITLKGLKKNKTYYVKVCAYIEKEDAITYGKYSAVKKYKTKK